MEPAGALSLPVETLHHISRYLSVEDILNCSLTCYYLRAALNDDRVWEKYTPEELKSVDKREQLVRPHFRCGQSLTMLCSKRIRYMKTLYIFENFMKGYFTEFSANITSTSTSSVLSSDDFSNQKLVIYQNRFALLSYLVTEPPSNRASKRAEFWDVETEPRQHCVLRLGNIAYSNFFVIESNLVGCWKFNRAGSCRVDVYRITLPSKDFPLLYSFFVTGNKVFRHEQMSFQSTRSQKFFGWIHFTAGHYLVSRLACGETRRVLHVWDIHNTLKVGSFVFPVEVSNISLHSFTSNYECVLKAEAVSQNSEQLFYLFSPKSKKFSDVAFKCQIRENNNRFLFYDTKVVLIEEQIYPMIQIESGSRYPLQSSNPYNSERFINCTLYEFATSKEILKRCFNTNRVEYPIKCIDIIDGKFIVLTFNCFHFVDVKTLSTVEYFECSLGFHCVLHIYNMFGSMLVLVKEYDDRLSFWDIKNQRKVSDKCVQLVAPGLRVTEVISSIVTIGKTSITVAHFW